MGDGDETDRALGAWSREPGTLSGRTASLPAGATMPYVIVTERHELGAATEWDPHAHPAHELVWVQRGTLTARVDDRVFTVSEGFGLWLPAGRMHAGRLTANLTLYDAFFAPEHATTSFDEPTVVSMTAALASLLIHLIRTDLTAAQRERAEAVVFDLLEPSPQQLALQLPNDARVDAIAETLLADPSDERSLDDWSRDEGTSARTITRAFRATTGLSFAQWRQSVRIHRAMALLTEGHEVQDVAARLGYAQPSTFIDAFRRVIGVTPGTFAESGPGL